MAQLELICRQYEFHRLVVRVSSKSRCRGERTSRPEGGRVCLQKENFSPNYFGQIICWRIASWASILLYSNFCWCIIIK